MDRDYKTGKSDSVGVFSGIEVEHTPAFGKQTLFLARNDLLETSPYSIPYEAP